MKKEDIWYHPKWRDYWILIPKPIIFSIFNLILWRYLHSFVEIEYKESYMLEILNGFLLSLYLLHTVNIYHKVEKEKIDLEKAWRTKKESLFCEILDERISKFTKQTQMVIVFGSLILFYVSPMSNYGGSVVIGVFTFFIYFLKEVTDEIDNPFKGIYRLNSEKIKERWPKVYEKYF